MWEREDDCWYNFFAVILKAKLDNDWASIYAFFGYEHHLALHVPESVQNRSDILFILFYIGSISCFCLFCWAAKPLKALTQSPRLSKSYSYQFLCGKRMVYKPETGSAVTNITIWIERGKRWQKCLCRAHHWTLLLSPCLPSDLPLFAY